MSSAAGRPTVAASSIAANGLEFTASLGGPEGGELVVFCHGFPQSRHTWRAETLALANAGYRVCAPDQRGYSRGARPREIDQYRLEYLVDDVLGIASALGHERCHLVGHDWGGQVAWVTAALHPDRVVSLAVLSRPHPGAFLRSLRATGDEQQQRSRHHRAYQRPEATDELLADGAARLRDIYARAGVPEPDAAAYLSLLAERPALDAALNWYRALRHSDIDVSSLPQITQPTLYVWGSDDSTVSPSAAAGTAHHVDGPYRFVELPDVGHFVTDQAPGVVGPLLIDHLEPLDQPEHLNQKEQRP